MAGYADKWLPSIGPGSGQGWGLAGSIYSGYHRKMRYPKIGEGLELT
jgi:hypothetical protein